MWKIAIKLIGTGDITDDVVIKSDGRPDARHHHDIAIFGRAPLSDERVFVEGFKRASNGLRSDHVGVSAYDGIHLIYKALQKNGRNTDGDTLICPRGPIGIDPDTRETIQNVYIGRVERVDSELYNVELMSLRP